MGTNKVERIDRVCFKLFYLLIFAGKSTKSSGVFSYFRCFIPLGKRPDLVFDFLYLPFLFGCTCAFSFIGHPVFRPQEEVENPSKRMKNVKRKQYQKFDSFLLASKRDPSKPKNLHMCDREPLLWLSQTMCVALQKDPTDLWPFIGMGYMLNFFF